MMLSVLNTGKNPHPPTIQPSTWSFWALFIAQSKVYNFFYFLFFKKDSCE